MPQRWISHFKRSKILPRILAGFAILAALLGVGMVVTSVQFNTLNAEFYSLLEHDLALVNGVERLHELLITMQNSKRAYLLTGDAEFLDGFNAARASVPSVIAQVRRETSDRSIEQRELDLFGDTVRQYVALAEPEIALRQRATRGEVPLDDVVDLLRHNNGLALADNGQRAILGLHARAIRAVEQQRRVVLTASALSRRLVVLTMVIALVVALLYGSMLSRDLGQALLGLRESIDAMARGQRIEAPHRNDEIGEVTRSFDVMADRLAIAEHDLRAKIEEQESTLAQLRVTNEALAQAMRVKSDFLSTMSHELRTPLNAVIGLSALLLDSPRETLSPRARRSLGSMRASGEQLLGLLNDMLDLAKADAGRMTLNPSGVPLEAAVRGCLDEVRAINADLNVGLRIESDGVERVIEADPQRMRQVLVNVISSAVRLTRSREVAVHLLPTGGGIDIEVRGIECDPSATSMTELFEEFSAAREGGGRRPNGTGLGLALSRRVTRLMGGDISVRTEGDGTCAFVLSFPDRPGREVRAHHEEAT